MSIFTDGVKTIAALAEDTPNLELLVDSGASMHMVPLDGLSATERKPMKKLSGPITLSTANGHTQAKYWTYVRVHSLDVIVPAVLLRNAPALLSMGMVCKENGYRFTWDPDAAPCLQKGR